MPILLKTKTNKKVYYVVRCPNCGYVFKQIGRPYNFWRDLKYKYKLNHDQLRAMQREMVRSFIQKGTPGIVERGKMVKLGKLAAIKPKTKR